MASVTIFKICMHLYIYYIEKNNLIFICKIFNHRGNSCPVFIFIKFKKTIKNNFMELKQKT